MEFWIECPGCRDEVLVDSESGAVLSHRPRKRAKGGGKSIEELLEVEKSRQDAAEDRFAAAFREEKDKENILEKRFQEALERAKEDPDKKPPLRDVDID
jgi:hypothetical protein